MIMTDFKIYTLYSGSGGNCAFFKLGNTSVLVDAGKSAKTLCKSLEKIGEDINNISAIFITHEHTDHVSALETLAKKYSIPIHITEQSAERFDKAPDSPVHSVLVRHPIIYTEQVGDIRVSSFRTSHDSRMSVGYRMDFCIDGVPHSVGIATDLGYISKDVREGLQGCEAVILECNHDVEMLMNGPYTYDMKMRISSNRGHLSNNDCADFAAELAASGMRGIILAHISRENNEPELAFDAVASAVSGMGVIVNVSHPVLPVEMIMGDSENVECEAYNPWNA